jgi:formamidopyrimidine-DNA glycosylase
MKGKIRVLIDEKTEYIAVVETLGSRINQLNRDIQNDEENVKHIQNNLQEMYETLVSHLKARGQMLETLKKMKTVKKTKDIDVEVHNPSEKISLENPEIQICISEEEWKRWEEIDREITEREKERKKEQENG